MDQELATEATVNAGGRNYNGLNVPAIHGMWEAIFHIFGDPPYDIE